MAVREAGLLQPTTSGLPVERPKFVDRVSCPAAAPRNLSGKSCCPDDYVWDKQDQQCRLGSSFRPDPMP
jgi:hypothetical protein